MCAAPAQAAIPEPAVSIGGATVRPSLLSGTETALDGGPTLIYDGFGLNPPTLIAAPGSAVTITTDMAVETVTGLARGDRARASRTRASARTRDVARGACALPAKLGVGWTRRPRHTG